MKWIEDAYERYDSDPRVSGPEDFEAFCEAVAGAYADSEEAKFSAEFEKQKREFDEMSAGVRARIAKSRS